SVKNPVFWIWVGPETGFLMDLGFKEFLEKPRFLASYKLETSPLSENIPTVWVFFTKKCSGRFNS
ncbi:MAG: hypothetical protein ACKPH7_06865, partial [Planktothrix sp.]|uniref:hypothetical protein n=1 Tax=Planktothrix sp. TaxID=3088171 RepID=UPI0038D47423